MARQTLQGVVTKAGYMTKTVTMTVERKLMHPKLLKEYTRHKKYLIHDEEDKLRTGDNITVEACRPLSARKRFTLLQINGSETEIAWRRERAKAMIPAEELERAQISKLIKGQMTKPNKPGQVMAKTQSSKNSRKPIPAANPSAPTSDTNRVAPEEAVAAAESSSNP